MVSKSGYSCVRDVRGGCVGGRVCWGGLHSPAHPSSLAPVSHAPSWSHCLFSPSCSLSSRRPQGLCRGGSPTQDTLLFSLTPLPLRSPKGHFLQAASSVTRAVPLVAQGSRAFRSNSSFVYGIAPAADSAHLDVGSRRPRTAPPPPPRSPISGTQHLARALTHPLDRWMVVGGA